MDHVKFVKDSLCRLYAYVDHLSSTSFTSSILEYLDRNAYFFTASILLFQFVPISKTKTSRSILLSPNFTHFCCEDFIYYPSIIDSLERNVEKKLGPSWEKLRPIIFYRNNFSHTEKV